MNRPPRPHDQAGDGAAPLPDRSLDAEVSAVSVAIRANGFHPFVYKKMVIGPTGPARPRDGDIVRVVDRDEQFIGYALWNSRSQIALRILSRDEAPPGLDFWVNRVDRAIELRRQMLDLEGTTNAYRVIHAEADGLSGLIVDRFDDVLSAEVFSLGMYQRSGPILGLIAERLGTKHARVQVDERIALAEDFPGRPAATPRVPPRVTIRENDVRFRVHFEHSHKTGFFCDQRENRQTLARYCEDRRVLDLCCYTGGFGIYALARGKAREVTCVDLDERAIALARENANANNVRPNLVHADAFGYMRQMSTNGRSFEVVVLDPPKLIPGRLDIASGKRKYFDLNVLALGLVEQGGLLLTCSCSGLLSPEEFLYLLRAAARKAGRSVQILATNGAAPDHPVGLDALEGAYLKAVWLRVGERFTPPGLTPNLDAGPEPDGGIEEGR